MEKETKERTQAGLMVHACHKDEMRASAKSLAVTQSAINNGMLISTVNWKEATDCFDLSDISVLLSGMQTYEKAEEMARRLFECFKEFVNDPSAEAEGERQRWLQKHCLEMKLTDDMTTAFIVNVERYLNGHPLSHDSLALQSLQQLAESRLLKAETPTDDALQTEDTIALPTEETPQAGVIASEQEQNDMERLHHSILQLMEEDDGKGGYLLKSEAQWYAIYYIATREEIVPCKMMIDFFKRLSPNNEQYRVKLNYENMKKINNVSSTNSK